MASGRVKDRAFTFIELMITVAIIAIVSVIGINSMSSRISSANVEETAKTLASDLAYARMTANLKGCPTRFIMCTNRNCDEVTKAARDSAIPAMSSQPSGGGGVTGAYIGRSTAPAQYYAILRQTSPCSSATDAGVDGYSNWDFDVRPRELPKGVVFSPIYVPGALDDTNANGTVVGSSLTVSNSLWFSSTLIPSTGSVTTVVTNPTTVSGNYVAFQVRMASCDPAATSDCLGYFVTISPGGVTAARRCVTGTARPTGSASDNCY